MSAMCKYLAAVSTALALALVASTASAELVATPLRGDSRLVQFHYDADNTFLLLTKPRAVTHVQFAADEEIQSVAAGDTANWELTPTRNRKNLFVKPKFEDHETSMTVLTNRRTYQFVLKSTADGKKWYQRVSWLYESPIVLEIEQPAVEPAPERVAARETAPSGKPATAARTTALRPDSLRFRYQIDGNAAFRPQVAFDDGRFVYLVMPAGLQEMPVVLAKVDGGEYALVNYTVDGNNLVVQRLVDDLVLTIGRSEVRVQATQAKPAPTMPTPGD